MHRPLLLLVLVAVVAALALWSGLRDVSVATPQAPIPHREQAATRLPDPAEALERLPAPGANAPSPASVGPGGRSGAPGSTAPGLHGVVKEYQGGGVSGILIELIDANGVTLLSTVSGERGRFAFPEVAPNADAVTMRVAPGGLPRIRQALNRMAGSGRMTLWIPPTGRITGIVVDARGQPVVGAHVFTDKPYVPMGMLAWEAIEGELPQASFQVETDASGRFVLEAAFRGTHRLRANAGGATGSVRARSDEQGVVLRLGEHLGGDVSFAGRVTNRLTGAPIANSRVQVMRVERSKGGYSAIGVANATTDANGLYEVQGLDVGRFAFCSTPDGFAQHEVVERDYDAGAHTVDMALMPARSLRVEVVLPDGAPATGASVRAHDARGNPVSMPGRLDIMGAEVRVDERGGAQLQRLPASQVTLTAVRGDFVPVGRVEVDLTAAAPELVTIRMPSTATRFARQHFFVLHDADGGPVEIVGTVVASAFDGEELVSRVEGRWSGDKFVLGNHAQYDFSRPTVAVGAPATVCRVEIVAPGYQPVTLMLEPGAKSPTRVELIR